MDKTKYIRLEKSRIEVKKKLEKTMRTANRYRKRLNEIEKQKYELIMADQPKLFPEMAE